MPWSRRILLAVRGHFDEAQVRQLFVHFGAKPQSYNSFRVYRPQGKDAKNRPGSCSTPTTIMYGDAPSLFAALDRSRFAPPRAGARIAGRAGGRDGRDYDSVVVMDATEMMSNDRLAAQLPGRRVGAGGPRIRSGRQSARGPDGRHHRALRL